MPSSVLISDLADVGPPRFGPDGSPVPFLRSSTSTDFLRYDRVEGLFTGLAVTLRLRDAFPGLSFRANGGSSSCQQHLEPKAEGSVHIPNSDQNPGRNKTSGNRRTALRFASNHISSLEK
jgi:hypothetical protein